MEIYRNVSIRNVSCDPQRDHVFFNRFSWIAMGFNGFLLGFNGIKWNFDGFQQQFDEISNQTNSFQQ